MAPISRSKLILVVVLLASQHLIPIAYAQQQDSPEIEAIFGEINSPFCPGRLLKDCPSSAATKLKDEIRERVGAGEAPNSIVTSLITTYGDTISPVPSSTGFGLVGWLAPLAFFGIGAVALLYWLIKNKKNFGTPDDDNDS